MSAFATEHKRAIALRLICSGQWQATEWPTVSQIVQNECLGLLPDGRLISRQRPQRPAAPIVSLEEAAGIVGVHPHTIRRWIRAGKLHPVCDNTGSPRLRREDVVALRQARSGN